MINLLYNYWAVEVPEGANGFTIEDHEVRNIIDERDMKRIEWDEDRPTRPFVIIPYGTWQIVCTSKEVTEDQAKELVQCSEWFFPERHIRYIDYREPFDTALKQKWGQGFGKATDSFWTLLIAKGCDLKLNWLILKKQ